MNGLKCMSFFIFQYRCLLNFSFSPASASCPLSRQACVMSLVCCVHYSSWSILHYYLLLKSFIPCHPTTDVVTIFLVFCFDMHAWFVYALGLYWSSAPAPAEIQPSLQIRLISGSGQNWARIQILPDLENFHYIIQIWVIYTCQIYFQQPTTAALMECATLSESGSHIVISKF